jgi:FkbM family methyltransferase
VGQGDVSPGKQKQRLWRFNARNVILEGNRMIRTLIPKMLLGWGRFYNRHTSFSRFRGAHARLICWGIKNFGFKAPLIKTRCGAVFEYAADVAFDVVANDLLVKGEFEPKETQLLKEFLPLDGVFLDVGANMGYFSVLAAKWVGPKGRVYAFEPASATYELLARNIAFNGVGQIVTASRLACFSSLGEMAMEQSADSGKSHLVRRADGNDGMVSLTTLDHFVEKQKISRVDCIKVDAEGCDFEVLKGTQRTIAQFRPPIIMETDNLELFGGSVAEVREFFKKLGYSIREVKLDHSIDFLCIPEK